MTNVPPITIPCPTRKKKIKFQLDSNPTQKEDPQVENEYFPPPIKTPSHKFAFSSNFKKTFQDFNFQNMTFTQTTTTSSNSVFHQRSNKKTYTSKSEGVISSPKNGSKSSTNLKKYRDIEEIAQSHNLKYNFKFPLQNPDTSNTNNNYFPTLTKLNKELIHTSIFKGKYQIEYSKKNYDSVIDYFHNKEEDGENKAKRLGMEFNERKQIAVGDLVIKPKSGIRNTSQRLTQGTFEKFKSEQEVAINSKQKVKSVMFVHKLMNLMEQGKNKQRHKGYNYGKALSEPSRRIHREYKENSMRTYLDKVDFGLLRQKINIYNLLKRHLLKPHSSSLLDVDIKDDLGENFEFGTNHSIKYGLTPHFLKTKFKRQTMYKYDGITGKFFGIPV